MKAVWRITTLLPVVTMLDVILMESTLKIVY